MYVLKRLAGFCKMYLAYTRLFAFAPRSSYVAHKSNAKKEVLQSVFKGKVDEITMGLINLLIENKRLDILQLVAIEYCIIYDFQLGVEVAQITSAVPLTKKLEDEILKRVKEALGKEVTLKSKIDPSIIGGFVLRVGDRQYDSSVSYRLNDLLSKFEDNQYISKL